MYCPDCGHNNPDGNRFCGMCGEALPDRNNKKGPSTRAVVTPAEYAPPVRETGTLRDTPREEPRESYGGGFVRDEPAHREKWVEAAPGPANPVYSRAERSSERRGTHHDSGTSFLGLGSQADEPPEREISWRFWALMLVLLGIVALFGMQWRANRMRAAEPPKPAAAQPSAEQPASTSGPSDDNPQQKGEAATPADQDQDQSAQPAASDKAATPDKQDLGKGADAKAKTEGKGAKAADPNAPDSNDDSTTVDQPKNKAPKTRAAAAPRESASPAAFSDEPVQQADARIAAGDCNGAVSLLRNAGSNPRAFTKLGAMYLTGTCVNADRVNAYAYFSQAFQADPHNLRLENTRRMIWSQMTDDEHARIEHGYQAQ